MILKKLHFARSAYIERANAGATRPDNAFLHHKVHQCHPSFFPALKAVSKAVSLLPRARARRLP